jgi:hypothetical protein
MQRSLRCKDAMRTTKKLDPFQRLEHIQAAGELQWDINQDKIVEAGANAENTTCAISSPSEDDPMKIRGCDTFLLSHPWMDRY